MSDHVVRAATPEEIAAAEERRSEAVEKQAAPEVKFTSKTPREKRVVLRWPVEVDGVPVEAITCRRLTGQQMMDMGDQNPVELVTGHPVEVIQALDVDDAQAVLEAATDFLPQSIRAPLQKAREEAVRKAESGLKIGQDTPQT